MGCSDLSISQHHQLGDHRYCKDACSQADQALGSAEQHQDPQEQDMIWEASATRQHQLSAEATMPGHGSLAYFDEKQNPTMDG